MLNIILKLEEGEVPDRSAKEWKVEGDKVCPAEESDGGRKVLSSKETEGDARHPTETDDYSGG